MTVEQAIEILVDKFIGKQIPEDRLALAVRIISKEENPFAE